MSTPTTSYLIKDGSDIQTINEDLSSKGVPKNKIIGLFFGGNYQRGT